MTNQKVESCPICGEGNLHEIGYDNEVTHNDHRALVRLKISECNICHSEIATDTQLLSNKRAIIEFQKTIDKRLRGAEVRSIRKALKLTQTEAASVFGGGRNAFSKYETDDICQSESMDKLIRLCHEVPQAYDWLIKDSGLVKAKPSHPTQEATITTYMEKNFMYGPRIFIESMSTTVLNNNQIDHLFTEPHPFEMEHSSLIKSWVTVIPAQQKALKAKDKEQISRITSKAYSDAEYDRFAVQGGR